MTISSRSVILWSGCQRFSSGRSLGCSFLSGSANRGFPTRKWPGVKASIPSPFGGEIQFVLKLCLTLQMSIFVNDFLCYGLPLPKDLQNVGIEFPSYSLCGAGINDGYS